MLRNMERAKILITGGTGLLGKYLIQGKGPENEILATYLGDYDMPDQKGVKYLKVDITDQVAQNKIFENFKPDVVIHTAAIGSPDFAEKHRDLTWNTNIGGTRNLLTGSETCGAAFIYVSSNGIYDGDNAPYSEESVPVPVNIYGEIKLEAEQLVKRSSLKTAIVRPILMYGWNHSFERQNIVTLAIAKLTRGEEMSVYDDVYCNPLYSRSCATAIWAIIMQDKYETYNIAGANRVSVFDLVKETARTFKLNEALIHSAQQGCLNGLVKRPRDTTFVTDKMVRRLGCAPLGLAAGLVDMERFRE